MGKVKLFWKKNYINLILIITIIIGFTTSYVLAVPNTVNIKAKIVNVRTGPMLSYNVMGQLKKGDQVPVLKQENGWYMIRLDGDKIGWIASWLTASPEIDSATNAIGVINTNQTNVRLYANTNSPILKLLNKGDRIKVVYTKDSWSQIVIDGKVGWVNNKLFDLTNEHISSNENSITSVYVLEPSTHLHSQDSLNAPIVTTLKQQDQLTVLGSSGDFYKVRSQNNIVGYVARRLVTTEIPPQVKITHPSSLSKATIIIDAGHGGNDPGAQANDNKHNEKTFTLLLAQDLKAKLIAVGAKVIMVRDTDKSISLDDRVKLTNKTKPSAFISIHLDSSATANQAEGMTTYYYSKKADLSLAKSVSAQLKGLDIPNRGVSFGDYEVLRESFYPSILIEMGYINNDHDFSKISHQNFRNQVTSKIVEGLNNYFK